MIGERQRMLTSHQLTSILETFVSWLQPCEVWGCQSVRLSQHNINNPQNHSLGKSSVGNLPALKCSQSDVYYYYCLQLTVLTPPSSWCLSLEGCRLVSGPKYEEKVVVTRRDPARDTGRLGVASLAWKSARSPPLLRGAERGREEIKKKGRERGGLF